MICETFHCTPDVAERQDWTRIRRILDYRTAQRGIELFNQGKAGFEQLEQEPGTMQLLLEMMRAQLGQLAMPMETMIALLTPSVTAEDEEIDG